MGIFWTYLKKKHSLPSLFFWAYQVIGCLVLLLLIPKSKSNAKGSDRESIAVNQFLDTWRMIWLFWLLLFSVYMAEEFWINILNISPMPNFPIFPLVKDFFNNLQTISLVICYVVVTKKTVDTSHPNLRLPWMSWLILLIIVTGVEALLLACLPKGYELTGKSPEFFTWFSAISAAVALALVVGRLDSKFINPPSWTVVMMYFYAAIQPVWGVFYEKKIIEKLFSGFAFILKCLIFLFIVWLFQSGVLYFYMERMAKLVEHVKKDRDAYREDFFRHRMRNLSGSKKNL